MTALLLLLLLLLCLLTNSVPGGKQIRKVAFLCTNVLPRFQCPDPRDTEPWNSKWPYTTGGHIKFVGHHFHFLQLAITWRTYKLECLGERHIAHMHIASAQVVWPCRGKHLHGISMWTLMKKLLRKPGSIGNVWTWRMRMETVWTPVWITSFKSRYLWNDCNKCLKMRPFGSLQISIVHT
jgi:hypothetical protein